MFRIASNPAGNEANGFCAWSSIGEVPYPKIAPYSPVNHSDDVAVKTPYVSKSFAYSSGDVFCAEYICTAVYRLGQLGRRLHQ